MKRKFCIMLLTCFALHASVRVYAQADSTLTDITALSLDDLQNIKITTASKTVMGADQVAASSYIVTENQIRVRGYRSLLDVLADAPDVKIDDKVYSLNRNTITLRGMDGQEKFLILLDGVRISSPTNETMPIMENYPVNLAKQVEIIFGPASALYGADAFSGIINIITKKSEFRSLTAEGSLLTGTQGLYNGNLFLNRKIKDELSLTFSGQYFYDEGVNLSRKFRADSLWDITSHQTGTFNTIYGPMTPVKPVQSAYSTPMQAYNIYASLHNKHFEFSFFKNYTRHSSALENTPNNAVYNRDVFIGKHISVLSAKHSAAFNKVSLVTSLSVNQYREDPETNYRNMYSGMEPAYKYAYGSMIQAEEQVEWKVSGNTNLVGGVVYQSFFSVPESTDLQNPVQDSRAIEGTMLNTSSFYRPEGLAAKFYALRYYNAGVYLQLQQKVFKHTNLTLGTRFDHNSRFGSTFNPRMGVVANISKKSVLKLMVGTSYLAPAPGSAYTYYGTFFTLDSGRTYHSNFFHLPNPNLKPMLSKNAEISFRQYVGKNFSAKITGYVTRVDNILEAQADNTDLYNGQFLGWGVDYIEIFVNEGRETITGGSLQLDYKKNIRKGSIKAYSYLSYASGNETVDYTDSDGVERSRDAEIDNNIARFIVKTGVDIQVSNFTFSPRMISMGNQRLGSFVNPENPMRRQTIPGYTTVNLSVGYTVGKATLFANVTNAFNQKYKAVGLGMDLNNNTGLFNGNYQDPVRVNAGVRFVL